ncbi:MAG TPA: signal peptidase I [Flavobacteriales bacterium]|nr:signal peptidase I [Flavobacteriales bacterium]
MSTRTKWSIYALAGLGLMVVMGMAGLAYARLTGALQFYVVPTAGCEPAIPTGSYIMAQGERRPGLFDLVCYMQTNPMYERAIFVQRVCGMPGDTVQIIEGRLHINGTDRDKHLRLKHWYRVPPSVRRTMHQQGLYAVNDYLRTAAGDSTDLNMEDRIMEQFPNTHRVVAAEPDEQIEEVFANGWNQDRFGPCVVPMDHYFLLGDNRNQSLDSRYLGMVHAQQIVGVVFHVF